MRIARSFPWGDWGVSPAIISTDIHQAVHSLLVIVWCVCVCVCRLWTYSIAATGLLASICFPRTYLLLATGDQKLNEAKSWMKHTHFEQHINQHVFSVSVFQWYAWSNYCVIEFRFFLLRFFGMHEIHLMNKLNVYLIRFNGGIIFRRMYGMFISKRIVKNVRRY